jgi:hypothetical protein
MATPDDKSKSSEKFRLTIRRLLDFTFGIENKRGEIIDYKLAHADSMNLSAQEFYARVEQAILARKLPGVEISKIHFAEGGLLSDQRVYLRLMRERLCIDTCAAPFGNNYFFSSRTVYVPAMVRLWHLLAASTFFMTVAGLLLNPLGLMFTIIATVGLLVALVGVMRNASSGRFADLDALLLKLPVIATIYEDWFRVDTYYRQDTRNLYLQLMPQYVQEIAEEICAAKGAKLERHFQPPSPAMNLNKLPVSETRPPSS